jgi:hypothetical protein
VDKDKKMAAVKSLFASPVGKDAKDNIRKIIERFGHERFDFLLLVYDGSSFDEPCFSRCRVVHDSAPLFWQLKRCLPPELSRRYEYVFVWMDDLDVMDFDPQRFLEILRAHRIEVAHPALSDDSVISHEVMRRQTNGLGRFTDFVEQMAFVFQGHLWERFWELLSPTDHPWGWGYDEIAYARCRFRRMAVIDSQVIRHLRQGTYADAARADQRRLHEQYGGGYLSRKRTLCRLCDTFAGRWLFTPVRLYTYYAYAQLYGPLGLGSVAKRVRRISQALLSRSRSDHTDAEFAPNAHNEVNARENDTVEAAQPESAAVREKSRPT